MANKIANYQFLPEFSIGSVITGKVEVKPEIFRFPTLLATNLSICMALDSQYPWDTYAKLHGLGILTLEDLQYMETVLALSIYIRISAYLTMRTQAKNISL